MLGGSLSKSQNIRTNRKNNGKDNPCNLESEYGFIINWSPERERFVKCQFGSPRRLSKSIPRRHISRLRFGMNRSLYSDDGVSRIDNSCHQSPNSSLESNSVSMKKSRDLSRSAKIMRALSSSDDWFCHRTASIKKSLNFDSTPSPRRKSNSDKSIHIDPNVNATLFTPKKSLSVDTDSTDISSNVQIASLESIDENQNQTPRQNRKNAKDLNDDTSDTKGNTNILASFDSSMNLFQKNIQKNLNHLTMSNVKADSEAFEGDCGRKALTYNMIASTPRNLSQAFNKTESDRPQTPENTIHLIPESMSSIKRSHKKERSYHHVKKNCVRQISVSEEWENENTCAETTTESLETDNGISTSCSYNMASMKEFKKKRRNIKKALVYNLDDDFCDELMFKPDCKRKAKQKDIDQNLCEMNNENLQKDVISDFDSCTLPPSSSSSSYDEKGEDSFDLQKESPSTSTGASTEEEKNVSVSVELEPTNSQDVRQHSGPSTPENHINHLSIIQHISKVSIKKSHKKIKQENKKTLFKPKNLDLDVELSKSEKSVEDITSSNDNICEDIEIKPTDKSCISSNQTISDRPNTPENINSSRLLLSHFTSVKKSHKKGKKNNRKILCIDDYQYEDHECQNKSLSPKKRNDRYEEKNRCKNKSFHVKRSSNSFFSKKKISTNMSLPNNIQMPSDFPELLSSGDGDDQFKIHTPIRKKILPNLISVTDCTCMIESRENEPVQTTSKKDHLLRCASPIARPLGSIKSRITKHLTCRKYANAENSRDDISSNDKSGRSTPINMSTTELLCNVNSIKRSHKKDKHNHGKKQILETKQSEHADETEDASFTSDEMLEEHTTDIGNDYTEIETCSGTRNRSQKNCEEITCDSQPSTNQKYKSIKSKRGMQLCKNLSKTPPNNESTMHFISLLHTTSIKKSHKKNRDLNAEAKYILMSKEHDLSDDGSIFDEEDRNA